MALKAGLLALLLTLCALPAVNSLRVWIYVLVPSDYDGELLLPHFINHYHQLGITWRRFLVQVHHNPGKYQQTGLETINGICMGYSLECRVWQGEYSAEAHMVRMLDMLNDYVLDPTDWIILANVDELQQWSGSIKDALEGANKAGSSHVMGRLVDRASASGDIAPVQQVWMDGAQSILKQYPMRCDVVGDVGEGRDRRVVAIKNYVRASRSGRRIITADEARFYYGPCPVGQPCPRGRSINLDRDVFNKTPYGQFADHYRYKYTPVDAHGGKGFGLWELKAFDEQQVVVHRIRWHAGALPAIKARMQQFGGDCVLGVNENQCTPLLHDWKDIAKTYLGLRATRRLDISALNCHLSSEDDEEEEGLPDTTYMGLAWEQFDPNLNVVSKIRNTATGDSQTRMAAKLSKAAGKGSSRKLLTH